MEQEIASAIKFIIEASGDSAPYYWEMPQDFLVPAVYFPPPEIESFGHTFNDYALSFSWFVKFFHKDAALAHEACLSVLNAIKERRCYIPLIDAEGRRTKRSFRMNDPRMRNLDGGATQLTLMWDVPRAYFAEPRKKIERFELNIRARGAFDSAVNQINEGD